MRLAVSLLIILCTLSLFESNAFSCGDKFLVVGRGLRYERAYPAAHPASILVYTGDSKMDKDLASSLKRSGHKLETATDETRLFDLLKGGNYDLVIVKLPDVARLEARIHERSSKPIVLPVIYKTNAEEFDAAKKQYNCIIKYSGRNKEAVSVIDQVMEAKLQKKDVVCKKG